MSQSSDRRKTFSVVKRLEELSQRFNTLHDRLLSIEQKDPDSFPPSSIMYQDYLFRLEDLSDRMNKLEGDHRLSQDNSTIISTPRASPLHTPSLAQSHTPRLDSLERQAQDQPRKLEVVTLTPSELGNKYDDIFESGLHPVFESKLQSVVGPLKEDLAALQERVSHIIAGPSEQEFAALQERVSHILAGPSETEFAALQGREIALSPVTEAEDGVKNEVKKLEMKLNQLTEVVYGVQNEVKALEMLKVTPGTQLQADVGNIRRMAIGVDEFTSEFDVRKKGLSLPLQQRASEAIISETSERPALVDADEVTSIMMATPVHNGEPLASGGASNKDALSAPPDSSHNNSSHNSIELPESSHTDSKILTPSEHARLAIDSQKTYSFQHSVYDAAFLVFTEYVRGFDSFFVILALLLNMALQVGVIGLMMTQFTEDPFKEEYDLQSLREWRQAEGHSYRNADSLTGVSLTARVCAMDPGLSSSRSQVTIIRDATDYLHNHNGFLMSTIAILVWFLTCAYELRMSIRLVVALIQLQITGVTELLADSDGFHILSLSFSRLLMGCSIALCRSNIAIFLGFYGGWWLAYTTSIRDLLLNASALAFVLDIDELVFAVVLPPTLSGIIESMQPLKFPRRIYILAVPPMILIGVLASTIFVQVELAQYIRDGLELARDILCAAETDLDFIVGATEVGSLVSARSVPLDEAATDLVRARRMVTQLLIDKSPAAAFYSQDVSGVGTEWNVIRVRLLAGRPFQSLVRDEKCLDVSDGAELAAKLYAITGLETVRSAKSCVDVAGYCRGASNSVIARAVRLKCPITCGCADPWSGMWSLANTESGCPWHDCRSILHKATKQAEAGHKCEDTPLSELQINANWTFMLDQMLESNMINVSVFNNLSRVGCPAFQPMEYRKRQLLCGTSDISEWKTEDRVFLGAGFMCPESCACIYPYMKGPQKGDDDMEYIPGSPGLCPRVACAEKYAESAEEYCVAIGLTLDREGDNLACDHDFSNDYGDYNDTDIGT